jgi:acyl-coenzyme A thioesterase PaaI-like protein
VVHARGGATPVPLATSPGDHGGSDPGVMGPHIGRIPFVRGRGIHVEHMAGGTSRLVMPWREGNGDADGCVADGAVLSLLDTAGAMAAWAETGPGRFRAGTPALHAQLLAPVPQVDLVAYGRCARRDGVLFFSDVEVATQREGDVVARGTVFYRIVP